MVFDISQLKKIRKQLNITQHQFAQQAGISQSMVAKIEAGRLDPTYSSVKKIEQALTSLTKPRELTARDLMHNKVITCHKQTKLHEVIRLLATHAISQVPVVDKENVLGLVTESTLLEHPATMREKTVEEIMQESPPIIAPGTTQSVILQLLHFFPLVLVQDNGKLAGVITKADIIKKL